MNGGKVITIKIKKDKDTGYWFIYADGAYIDERRGKDDALEFARQYSNDMRASEGSRSRIYIEEEVL